MVRKATARFRAPRSSLRSSTPKSRSTSWKIWSSNGRSRAQLTPGSRCGFDEDPEVAGAVAVDGMLDLMERELGVTRPHALALASVAVDVRVTQVVNGVKGVHAVLRDDAIRLNPA